MSANLLALLRDVRASLRALGRDENARLDAAIAELEANGEAAAAFERDYAGRPFPPAPPAEGDGPRGHGCFIDDADCGACAKERARQRPQPAAGAGEPLPSSEERAYFRGLNESFPRLRKQIVDLRADNARLAAELASMHDQYQGACKEVERYLGECNRLERELDDEREAARDLTAERDRVRGEVFDLRAECDAARAELAEAQARIAWWVDHAGDVFPLNGAKDRSELQRERDAALARLEEAQYDLEEAKRTIAQLDAPPPAPCPKCEQAREAELDARFEAKLAGEDQDALQTLVLFILADPATKLSPLLLGMARGVGVPRVGHPIEVSRSGLWEPRTVKRIVAPGGVGCMLMVEHQGGEFGYSVAAEGDSWRRVPIAAPTAEAQPARCRCGHWPDNHRGVPGSGVQQCCFCGCVKYEPAQPAKGGAP